jgi:hypothetical protein
MFFFLPFYKEFKPLNGTRQQHTSKKRKMPWLGISVLATIQKNDELIMDDMTRSLQTRGQKICAVQTRDRDPTVFLRSISQES